MNISVLISAIVEAKGCPPGHVNYLRKDDMSDIAERVLPEVHLLISKNKQLLGVCRLALEWHAAFPHGNQAFEYDSSIELYEQLQTVIAAAKGEARHSQHG